MCVKPNTDLDDVVLEDDDVFSSFDRTLDAEDHWQDEPWVVVSESTHADREG